MPFLYNNIFNIPERSVLDKKLTKAFFLKNFDLSATEKKLLNNSIQSMDWMASIKPTIANIPAVVTDNYAYEEIQIMVCTIADNKLNELADKCIVLLQKYIPYQMIVIVEDATHFVINACDKRINLNDSNKRTIENYNTTTAFSKLYKNEIITSFFNALDFSVLDKTNMETTYKSYIQAIVQFQTATITGSFSKRSHSRTEEDMMLLANIETIENEVVRLSNQIKKETQLNNRVSLNIEIQNQRKEIEKIKNKLGTV
ncbi:DUF4391 domain-containing protein [Flavobacterium sp. SUN052]|uniref:DUF4391 domain-containing protein n=1 Tax=Flavobacterium sp. SUN052 TaxID=3002441 RepID=UPI00237DE8A9|nr:DUF4391 domain-containing protein [Flavobacterium sp. SUN052]MEC4005512.1 DUF4391 domain-containing protein [Flavobacterium sp. SUN052]